MSDSKVREQPDNGPFIKWWNAQPSKPPQMVAFALNVWAASRAAALEEAAQRVDDMIARRSIATCSREGVLSPEAVSALMDATFAIRALAGRWA